MSRYVRCLTAVALACLGLLLLPRCDSDDDEGPGASTLVGRSYVYGSFEGALAKQLIQVFSPQAWSGQTDGPVLVAADKIVTLSDDQRAALRTVLSEGHAIVVSEVTQDHLERLHGLSNSVPAISLDPSTADSAALYVLARPGGRMRAFVVASFPDDGSGSAELEAAKTEHAQQVAQWFLMQRKLHTARSSALATRTFAEGDSYDTILGTDFPFSVTLSKTMAAEYSDRCGAIKTCYNAHSVTISSVGVHNPYPTDPMKPGETQPADYVIAHLDGIFNSGGCKLALGVQSGWQTDRWAGYWTRQANMSAAVHSPIVYEDGTTADILDGAAVWQEKYAPQAAQPDTTYTKGMTVSLGISGTVSGGVSAKEGPSVSGSLGVTGGVSYTNETQTGPFKAVAVIPQVKADPSNPTKVAWSFDSWQHVVNNIKPGNHACGGPGLDVSSTGALPTEIYGSSMSRHAEWVWQLMPEVRAALAALKPKEPTVPAYKYLPVDLSGSVLMGWAFFPAMGAQYCRMGSSSLGQFDMAFMAEFVDVVGTESKQSTRLNGLAFDPGCGTEILFGTIPLGSWTANTHDGSNVGAPFSFGTITVNLPLAPDPYEMELTEACVVVGDQCRLPLSGPSGSVIRLKGKSLHTATRVEVGGQEASSSMSWPLNTEPYIEVTAPYRQAPGEQVNAAISVKNAVTTKGGFTFTYTN